MNRGIKASLYRYLDALPAGKISAWELFAAMQARTGRKTMPSTLLQYARDYADASGASFVCVDPAESTYRYEPGFKIAGALTGFE